jgi:hypothetical protein
VHLPLTGQKLIVLSLVFQPLTLASNEEERPRTAKKEREKRDSDEGDCLDDLRSAVRSPKKEKPKGKRSVPIAKKLERSNSFTKDRPKRRRSERRAKSPEKERKEKDEKNGDDRKPLKVGGRLNSTKKKFNASAVTPSASAPISIPNTPPTSPANVLSTPNSIPGPGFLRSSSSAPNSPTLLRGKHTPGGKKSRKENSPRSPVIAQTSGILSGSPEKKREDLGSPKDFEEDEGDFHSRPHSQPLSRFPAPLSLSAPELPSLMELTEISDPLAIREGITAVKKEKKREAREEKPEREGREEAILGIPSSNSTNFLTASAPQSSSGTLYLPSPLSQSLQSALPPSLTFFVATEKDSDAPEGEDKKPSKRKDLLTSPKYVFKICKISPQSQIKSSEPNYLNFKF